MLADSAERADAPSRERDREGAQPQLPAAETAIRGNNSKTPCFHRSGTRDANCRSKSMSTDFFFFK